MRPCHYPGEEQRDAAKLPVTKVRIGYDVPLREFGKDPERLCYFLLRARNQHQVNQVSKGSSRYWGGFNVYSVNLEEKTCYLYKIGNRHPERTELDQGGLD